MCNKRFILTYICVDACRDFAYVSVDPATSRGRHTCHVVRDVTHVTCYVATLRRVRSLRLCTFSRVTQPLYHNTPQHKRTVALSDRTVYQRSSPHHVTTATMTPVRTTSTYTKTIDHGRNQGFTLGIVFPVSFLAFFSSLPSVPFPSSPSKWTLQIQRC